MNLFLHLLELLLWHHRGRKDVDYCKVKVYTNGAPEDVVPTIFMTYAPSEKVRVGEPVTFRFWLQGADKQQNLAVDFGDGGTIPDYMPYSSVRHSFDSVGIHVVTASTVVGGLPVTQKIKVLVGG